jgi:RimJ/RimL family protein N-acetyltransferase
VIVLRELERSDVPTINRWRNDRALVARLGAPFRRVNIDTDLDWYARYLSSRSTQVRCAVCTRASSRLVGLASLTHIDPVHRSAEYHIMIGPVRARGRGAGTAATREMLRHAFEDLNLHRVYLSVLEDNREAVALYEKMGFTHEGRSRQAVYKDGRYRDMLQMAILAGEYRARAAARSPRASRPTTDTATAGGREP